MTGDPSNDAVLVRREKFFVAALLALTLVIRVATLIPDVRWTGGMLNDAVLHDATIRAASRSIGRFENPFDLWLDSISIGYPFLRQYQPLPHVLAAIVHRASFGGLDASQVRAILTMLALAAFPFAVYRAARDLGLGRLPAAGAAAVAPLLEAPLLLGITDQAYVWRGYGLYTQALAAPLFALGTGAAARAIATGRGQLRAGLYLGGALLCHFILGWLASLFAAAFAVFSREAPLKDRANRLAAIGATAAALSAWAILPAVSTAAYANKSATETPEKWNGVGLDHVLFLTGRGVLLDGDADQTQSPATRVPVVSILAGLGLLLALAGRRERLGGPYVAPDVARRLLAILGVSIFIFAGRKAFGPLVDLVPGVAHLHIHRAIAGMHLAAILLAGVALGAIPGRLRLARWPIALAWVFVAELAILAPAVVERWRFHERNAEWAQRSEERLAADLDIQRILGQVQDGGPGRLYAGHPRRDDLVTRVPDGPALDAIASARDIPNLGHLWHPYAVASDVAFFHFDPYRAEDAATFGVRWLALPAERPPPPYAREVARSNRLALYENPGLGAGAFGLVSAPRRIDVAPRDALEAIRAWYQSPERAAGVAPLLALAGERWEPAGPPGRAPHGQIVLEGAADGRFDAEVVLEEPGWLVAKIGYHPALGATVDGAPRAVACVAPGFPAVRLEPGRHRVSLYVAGSTARAVLALAGTAALALLWRALRRPRSRATAESEGAP